MSPNSKPTVTDLMRDNAGIQKAMQQAMRVHKLLGHPIATWRDGNVVVVPPEEIQVEEDAPPKLPQDVIP